ncbi:MAG: hypothetical protein JRI34_13980 [Deltaproteobacteria bacterium]|nr:hypothetical protein [Deltaproteobacteria bacterium]
MSEEKTLCVECAWRKDCLKRYKYESSTKLRCPEFTRDVTLPKKEKKES